MNCYPHLFLSICKGGVFHAWGREKGYVSRSIHVAISRDCSVPGNSTARSTYDIDAIVRYSQSIWSLSGERALLPGKPSAGQPAANLNQSSSLFPLLTYRSVRLAPSSHSRSSTKRSEAIALVSNDYAGLYNVHRRFKTIHFSSIMTSKDSLRNPPRAL